MKVMETRLTDAREKVSKASEIINTLLPVNE
jgi:hypothetical protein